MRIEAGRPGAQPSASVVTRQCTDDAAGARVGTLVIVPKDRDDADVEVVVVAGGTRPVEQCASAPATTGCLVMRYTVRFSPGAEIDLPVVVRSDGATALSPPAPVSPAPAASATAPSAPPPPVSSSPPAQPSPALEAGAGGAPASPCVPTVAPCKDQACFEPVGDGCGGTVFCSCGSGCKLVGEAP